MPLSFRSRAASITVLGLALGVTVIGVAVASDHQDTPEVELNALSDMTDVYAFPSPTAGRIVLVMNSRAFLTPAQSSSAGFDRNLLYQFKIDNTGDAVEDRVIQVTFTGTGPGQQVEVRGPMAPPVVGAMTNELGSAPPVLMTPGLTTDNVGNHSQFLAAFPYLAIPN